MKLLIDIPILLDSSKTFLQHPACIILGKNQEQQTFKQRVLEPSSRVSVPRQPKDMTATQLHWEMESVLS